MNRTRGTKVTTFCNVLADGHYAVYTNGSPALVDIAVRDAGRYRMVDRTVYTPAVMLKEVVKLRIPTALSTAQIRIR